MANISKTIKNIYGPLTRALLLSNGLNSHTEHNEYKRSECGIYSRAFLEQLEFWKKNTQPSYYTKYLNQKNNSAFNYLISKSLDYLKCMTMQEQQQSLDDMINTIVHLWEAQNNVSALILLTTANEHLKENQVLALSFTPKLCASICLSDKISTEPINKFLEFVQNQYGNEFLHKCIENTLCNLAKPHLKHNTEIDFNHLNKIKSRLPLCAQYIYDYIESISMQKKLNQQITNSTQLTQSMTNNNFGNTKTKNSLKIL